MQKYIRNGAKDSKPDNGQYMWKICGRYWTVNIVVS